MAKDYNMELKQRIDEVLYYVWDPIGVSDAPEARNEYSSYVGMILNAAIEGKSKENIAKYLTEIANVRMGLDPGVDHDIYTAELIIKWVQLLK
jgi:hypothetical protein